MAPLKFGDFCKSAKDILNDDYCFDRKFKVKTSATNGLTLTTEGSMKASNKVATKLTAKIPLGHGITLNKIGVSHTGRFFADASLDGVVPNLSLKTVVEDGAGVPPFGELSATYKHNLFTSSLKINALNGPLIKEDISAKLLDNVTIGASAVYQTGLDSKEAASLKDYNVGLAVTEKDFTISAVSKKKLSEFEVGVHHLVSDKFKLGATYSHGKTKGMALGAIYNVDSDLTLQGKVESSGLASLNILQKLNKKTKLVASAQVDATTLHAYYNNFGLSLTLN